MTIARSIIPVVDPGIPLGAKVIPGNGIPLWNDATYGEGGLGPPSNWNVTGWFELLVTDPVKTTVAKAVNCTVAV